MKEHQKFYQITSKEQIQELAGKMVEKQIRNESGVGHTATILVYGAELKFNGKFRESDSRAWYLSGVGAVTETGVHFYSPLEIPTRNELWVRVLDDHEASKVTLSYNHPNPFLVTA